ncbi:MAG: hypothetical protein JO257_18835 [Deltaproteobacteria bacterium]|nr:hypothetical protein [Deltaproteobacteria bacterium]
MSIDVTVVGIAVDSSVTKFVQDGLARLPDDNTKLRELGLLLRRVRDAWVAGGVMNDPIRRDDDGMAAFAKHVADVRAVASTGSAMLLVTLIVAARGELATISDASAAEELRRALESAAYRDDIVAVEVIATGIADLLPGMVRMKTSLAGKIVCASCGAPFPAELVSCPSCGAPATRR